LAVIRFFSVPLAGLEPLAFASELKDRVMVHETIDNGGRCHRIGKDIRPIGKREIRTNCDALSFVPARDNLKEQVGRFSLEGNIPKFIDQHEIESPVRSQLAFELPVVFSSDHPHQ